MSNNQIYIPNNNFIPLQEQNPHLQNQNVITNQIPRVIYVDATNFKTSPINTICPICHNQIETKVNTKCNWYSCLLCYFTGVINWAFFQWCRNKKLNCCDAEHFCPACGNKIVDYNSC